MGDYHCGIDFPQSFFKDNHCCIFRCTLLMNFDCSIRLIERYPAPGLNVRVFFCIEKKLLLQGSKGLTRVALPYITSVWGLETMPVHPQRGFIQKHTIRDFALLFFSSFLF